MYLLYACVHFLWSLLILIFIMYVCMYRGQNSWRCLWDQAFQLGQREGPIGLVGPIYQHRGTTGSVSPTLVHTYALMCTF